MRNGSAGSTPSIIMDVGVGADRNPLLKMAWRLHARFSELVQALLPKTIGIRCSINLGRQV